MKTFIFVILLFLGFQVLPESYAARSLNIGQALKQKLVKCSIEKADETPDSLSGRPGYIMNIILINTTSERLNITFEPGRRFISSDTVFQNLMITQERRMVLNARQTRSFPFVGYCINKRKSSPGNKAYHIGDLAQGLLLKVACFLGKNKIISKAAQAAIWVISDQNNIENVTGKSKAETRLVRNYLYDITGIPRPPRSSDPLSYPAVSVSGEISWDMQEAGKISIIVTDDSGKTVGKLVNERYYDIGKPFYSFHYLDDALIPQQTYKIRVMNGEAILKETLTLGKEEKFIY